MILNITPFETEARMLFGVIFMDRIFEAQEKMGGEFDQVRDHFWYQQLPPEVKHGFLQLARSANLDGPLPETPEFIGS